jgi:hypothetical protein
MSADPGLTAFGVVLPPCSAPRWTELFVESPALDKGADACSAIGAGSPPMRLAVEIEAIAERL